jgi:hypothetical protein
VSLYRRIFAVVPLGAFPYAIARKPAPTAPPSREPSRSCGGSSDTRTAWPSAGVFHSFRRPESSDCSAHSGPASLISANRDAQRVTIHVNPSSRFFSMGSARPSTPLPRKVGFCKRLISCKLLKRWSGRRGSNPRRPAWETPRRLQIKDRRPWRRTRSMEFQQLTTTPLPTGS